MFHLMRSLCALAVFICIVSTGCASYATPGRPADMSVFGVSPTERENLTDYSIRQYMNKTPLAQFPATIAVVRVQGSGYKSHRYGSYGRGKYSVVTTREAELEEHLVKIKQLPLVANVAAVNRLLLPQELESDKEVRNAAAQLHADLLLVYTLDTNFHANDVTSPLDIVTFGFLPHKKERVSCTASAALLDTRNGYLYAVAEASSTHSKIANSWTSESACDKARQLAEAEALEKLVDEFENAWQNVVHHHMQSQTVKPPSMGKEVPQGERYHTGK